MINFIRICGDFPVNSKLIPCNAYIFFFHAISTCGPEVKNYGDSFPAKSINITPTLSMGNAGNM